MNRVAVDLKYILGNTVRQARPGQKADHCSGILSVAGEVKQEQYGLDGIVV